MRDVSGTITRMGGQGHGILDLADGTRAYVPFTVPGDQIAAKLGEQRGDGFAASLNVLEEAGPDRVEPLCQHFHACGGCALQHWAEEPYREWKRDRLVQALRRRGLDIPVNDLVAVPPASRRRAEFAVRRIKAAVLIGFHEAQSRKIVDLVECPVARPALLAPLPGLRAALLPVLGDGWAVDLKLTETETGLDLLLTGNIKLNVEARIALSRFAKEQGFARFSWRRDPQQEPELLFLGPEPPRIRFGAAAVVLPPGGFLQATAEAEQAMADLALAALQGARRVADLYSGCGAFGLRLAAAGHQVLAADADRAAIAALTAGAKAAGLAQKVAAETRDLDRRPLLAAALKKFDAVLLDPPRAGAPRQVQALAAAEGGGPPQVVMASCDPGSFARDAAALVQGGYRAEAVTPIDQFLWSPHLEMIGVFRR